MERVGMCAIVAMDAGVGVVFAVDPTLDLHVARYFHDLFAGAQHAPWYALIATPRSINQNLTIAFLCLAVAALPIKCA